MPAAATGFFNNPIYAWDEPEDGFVPHTGHPVRFCVKNKLN